MDIYHNCNCVNLNSEQLELKQKVIEADADVVMEMRRVVEGWSEGDCQFYLGGVDISFVKGDNVNACAALVVVSFPDLEVSGKTKVC